MNRVKVKFWERQVRWLVLSVLGVLCVTGVLNRVFARDMSGLRDDVDDDPWPTLRELVAFTPSWAQADDQKPVKLHDKEKDKGEGKKKAKDRHKGADKKASPKKPAAKETKPTAKETRRGKVRDKTPAEPIRWEERPPDGARGRRADRAERQDEPTRLDEPVESVESESEPKSAPVQADAAGDVEPSAAAAQPTFAAIGGASETAVEAEAEDNPAMAKNDANSPKPSMTKGDDGICEPAVDEAAVGDDQSTPPPAGDPQADRRDDDDTPVRRPPPERSSRPPGRLSEGINLANISGDDLLDMLNEAGITFSGSDLYIEVVDDKIIITGNEDDVLMAEALIRLLDESVKTKQVEIMTLEYKDADEVARSVENALGDLLDRPNLRPDQKLKITAVSNNILVVAALPEDLEMVVGVIKRLDAVPPRISGEWQTFQIHNRRASDVAAELEKLLEKMREQMGGEELAIQPNDADNTVMVLAPQSERNTIQSLIDAIDVEPVEDWGKVRMVMFPLKHSDADNLASVIEELLAAPQGDDEEEENIFRLSVSEVMGDGELRDLEPIDLSRTIRIIPHEGTNSLLVATVEKNIRGFGELVRMLDGVPQAEELDVAIIPLRFADAQAVAEIIEEMFDDGSDLPNDPDDENQDSVPPGEIGTIVYNISIKADQRTNALVVAGRPEQLSLVGKLVIDLDKPAGVKFPLRLVRLDNSDATRIGKVLTEFLEKRFEAMEDILDGQSLERERVFLTVDVTSNALILSASDENLNEIEEMVRQLDARPSGFIGQIGIIPCTRLSAADLVEKIETLFERKSDLMGEWEQEDAPVIVVDHRSNSLVVAGSPEDLAQIRTLVETLESQPIIEDVRIFKLKFADAVGMAAMLEELFEGIADQSDSDATPTIIPDERSNALIVAASREAMQRVEEIVERLDVEAGPPTAVFKIYALTEASAVKLAEKVQELFDQRQDGDGERTPIVIMAEEGSNSLIASASRDDHTIIADLLELLDRPSNIARQVEIFPLKSAKAETLADQLDNLFTEEEIRPDAIAIEPDIRTNALIVWASPSEMENIASMIEKLDTTGPKVEMMFRVIRLEQALAEDFAESLEEVLFGDEDEEAAVILSFVERYDDGTEVERRLLRQDIRLTADARTNSLLVMAPAQSMDMLEALIKQFDLLRPIASEIRLFELENSDAETMKEQLDELFDTEGGGGGDDEIRTQLQLGGREDLGLPAAVGQELRFAADRRTNTIIASGAEIDLRMVEELVRYLDSKDVDERLVDVYKPRYIDPAEMADVVTEYVDREQEPYDEIEDERSALLRAEQHVTLVSVGDIEEEGGASVIVGTSQRNYPKIMELIHQLDRPEPQVMISVLVAEVTLEDRLELGIEFAGQDLNFSENAVLGPNGTLQGSDFDFVAGTDIGAAGQGLGGFSFSITGEDFNFLLRTIQSESKLEVLSRPTLMVENNQPGKINIGDRVPIVSSTDLGRDGGRPRSTIDYEEVGIILEVTPHITPDGFVRMLIAPEISQISGQSIQLTEGLTAPVFSERRIESNITVKDGETVVLGGLITTSVDEGETKIPILGDLPGIGVLFRSTRMIKRRSELLVVLTVHVLRTPEDVYEISTQERDRHLSESKTARHPLMQGLRILPDEELLGPRDDSKAPQQRGRTAPRPDRNRELYGPKPQRYGPIPGQPTAKYGPKLPRATTSTARADAGSAGKANRHDPAASPPSGVKPRSTGLETTAAAKADHPGDGSKKAEAADGSSGR